MPNRKRKGKKKFDCGHIGFGKYCHLCEQIKNGELIRKDGKYIKPEVIKDEPKIQAK